MVGVAVLLGMCHCAQKLQMGKRSEYDKNQLQHLRKVITELQKDCSVSPWSFFFVSACNSSGYLEIAICQDC